MIEIKQEWIDAGALASQGAWREGMIFGVVDGATNAVIHERIAAAVIEAVAPMIEAAVDSGWYSTMLDGATTLNATVERDVRNDIVREIREDPQGHEQFCATRVFGDTCSCPVKEIADRIAAGGEHVAN